MNAGNPAGGRRRWGICALLFGAATINYLDRQVIGILKLTQIFRIGRRDIERDVASARGRGAIRRIEAGEVIGDGHFGALETLPTLPIWLDDDCLIPLNLESSYEETCRILRIQG